MSRRRTLIGAFLLTAWGSMCGRAAAQPSEGISLRPFFVVTGERFSAKNTFQTVFGSSFQPMFGGGLDVAFENGLFIDVTASRFSRTGQTGFFFDGQGFQLGRPLSVSVTPIEVAAGYRFVRESWPRIVPYGGAGAGYYIYKEEADTVGLTQQEISAGANVFEAKHGGFLAVGGVEVRISEWVAVSGDVQYSRVPDILGAGGVSQGAGESNLGGLAVRGRVLVGH
jgi:hypothetical protein